MVICTRRFIFLLLLIWGCLQDIEAQLPFNLTDSRDHRYCESCTTIIDDMPPEVLWGVHINGTGDIYFSMNNRVWFDKIIKNNSYGIAADIVSKDRFACGRDADTELPLGHIIAPVYRTQLLEKEEKLLDGQLLVKIGKVPASLKGKELECNLIVVNGTHICYYTNFLDIDRGIWKLLPMGFYTDSLIAFDEVESDEMNVADIFNRSETVKIELPFSKSASSYDEKILQRAFDSLQLERYTIRKVDIRIFASVEGALATNQLLMQNRADAVINGLKKYSSLVKPKTVMAENWLAFYNDIDSTKFSELGSLSKGEIKVKLHDPLIAKELEPVFAKHRKAVLILSLIEKGKINNNIHPDALLDSFKLAVSSKNINAARIYQKQVFEKIADKTFPMTFADRLEVPAMKEYAPIVNDREVYKYLLKATSEYEALENFLAIQRLDPDNGKLNYNIAVLRFHLWQYGNDTASKKQLPLQFKSMPRQGLHETLISRMRINYAILDCEDQMQLYHYDAKDSSLEIVKSLYSKVALTDEEIFSLAKFFAFYAAIPWAEEIVAPRITQLNVSENLLFYYINIMLMNPGNYETETFTNSVRNAIALNRKRFCRFFNPMNKGGASFQLLQDETLKEIYCEECK
jgi:hypothetical protein